MHLDEHLVDEIGRAARQQVRDHRVLGSLRIHLHDHKVVGRDARLWQWLGG